jgi:hypothetical protein
MCRLRSEVLGRSRKARIGRSLVGDVCNVWSVPAGLDMGWKCSIPLDFLEEFWPACDTSAKIASMDEIE